jgi:hypothetical protein
MTEWGMPEMTALNAAWNRIYGDFLQGSRLDAYRAFLETALRAGYRVASVGALWRLVESGDLDPARRFLVLRHDVDTDPATARAMWEIDRALGIEASFFFRLSTLDLGLMAEIAAEGSEASYHYEELATLAKRLGLRDRSAVMTHLPEARDRFAENLGRLRQTTGLPMSVVASHGDFVNRHLGLPNWVLLTDTEFRRQVGIELETYDAAFLGHLPSRHADGPPPTRWSPVDPAVPIGAGEPIVSVLVHPRHWRVNRSVNARDDLQRVVEGVRFALGGRRTPVGPSSR